MHLAIFGATGKTGQYLVNEALRAEHSVTAIVRNPDKLQTPPSPKLRVVVADVMKPTEIGPEIVSSDAVISTIGSPGRAPSTVMTDSARSIVKAMLDTGPKRLVVISGSMVDCTGDGVFLRRVGKPLARRIFSGAYVDMKGAEALLHESHLLWTIMRPPRLVDRPEVGECRSAVDTNMPKANRLARGDLARATLKTLDDPSTIERHVFLGP